MAAHRAFLSCQSRMASLDRREQVRSGGLYFIQLISAGGYSPNEYIYFRFIGASSPLIGEREASSVCYTELRGATLELLLNSTDSYCWNKGNELSKLHGPFIVSKVWH